MSRFLNPTGRPSYGIALCDRCKRKFFISELRPDPDSPGLMVCVEDLDNRDPWKLPPRPTETIVLPFVRPDEKESLP